MYSAWSVLEAFAYRCVWVVTPRLFVDDSLYAAACEVEDVVQFFEW